MLSPSSLSPSHLRFSPSVAAAPSPRTRFRPISASAATAERSSSSSPSCFCPPKSASSCCYDILGLSISAGAAEIKAAYRKLARICHPDVAGDDRKEISSGEFMKIHAAYSTLSDPEKRADYDRQLLRRLRRISSFAGIPPSPSPNPQYTGYTGRKWETDQCW